ncbi:TM209-like protein [Mya arenaria]|uniref:TM209-like protein n=1 Tax=Mya arenaria TaxID=6604 RepID=A0ABY7EXT2_MYAAR|nr:TM209-like protein [Mya arenaria]
MQSAPSDKMTDLQSLSVYLKEQDEKDYKAALGCQDMSLNSSSFWSYGRPSLDLSHVFRNNQFQLASQSQQSHKSWTNDSDYLGEEVWRTLGVTDDLFLWIERLRKSWEVMGVSASSCGIEVVVGASMGNHGANICPQILRTFWCMHRNAQAIWSMHRHARAIWSMQRDAQAIWSMHRHARAIWSMQRDAQAI